MLSYLSLPNYQNYIKELEETGDFSDDTKIEIYKGLKIVNPNTRQTIYD